MRVLAVGHCTLDQIGFVEHFARDDEEVEMPTFSVQGGGTAATAAVALARWGASPSFVGKVGDDDRGDKIVRTLQEEGVQVGQMVRDAGAISQVRFVIVEVNSGRRQTYYTPGNVGPLLGEEVDPKIVDGHDLLLVDGVFPAVKIDLMKRAQEQGIPVVLEADHDRHVVGDCVTRADVVVASEREASAFTGVGSLQGICEAFLEQGPELAIVTLGDEGAVAMGRDGALVRVEATPVDVVDTMGAADVFLGAVGLGVLEGWSLEKMVRFAIAAAGEACTGPGGRSSIASREALQAQLNF